MDYPALTRRSVIIFSLACAAALALVALNEGLYWQAVETLDEQGDMSKTRLSLQRLQRSMLDAETSQRGYLLTGRSHYLSAYKQSLEKIEEAYRLLKHYYAQEPASLLLLERMRGEIDKKLTGLATAITSYDQGNQQAVYNHSLSAESMEQMDAISLMSNQLMVQELQSNEASRDYIYNTLKLSRVGVAAMSAAILFALFMYLRQVLRLDKVREKQRLAIQVERDGLEREVMQRTLRLTELTQHLETAREDERHRLARDLHDELGALLTSAKLDAARIKSRLAGIAPEALERLGHLVDTLNQGIALKRRIIEDLRPSSLSNLGLVQTLEILARDFADRSGIEVHCDLHPVQLQPSAELVVYRLMQEAITNIVKYAKAKQLWMRLTAEGQRVVVSVRDDGVGFDTNGETTSAYGLMGMRYRVEAEHGTMALRSAPGQGTLIQVELPQSGVALTEALA
ncbi:MAG: CHASE3 domain-containing protein [Burkholderiales bacterium]